MKVVGGPHDGQQVAISEAGHYRLLEILDAPWIAVGPPLEISPIGPTIKEHIYTVRRFYFSRDDYYEFLAPHEWSDKQALLHQFSK